MTVHQRTEIPQPNPDQITVKQTRQPVACPDCRDTGIITRPYIAGVVSVMTVCHCAAGKAQMEHINKQMEAKNAARTYEA